MFEPMQPPPQRHRHRSGRFAQAIAAAAQREENEAKAREEEARAAKVERARIEIEEEIKRKLASDSDEEYEINPRYGVWEARHLKVEEEEEKTSGWVKALLTFGGECAREKGTWKAVCFTSVLTAVIVVFVFWMEWL